MAKKVIRLNKKQFREIIQESVHDVLNRLEPLNEMAVPLKNYKDRVDGLRFQLVENWCLCKYSQLYNQQCPNRQHWVVELKACINNLKMLDIKNRVDKRKVLIKMLVDDYDYDDPNMINRIISDKFMSENISDNQILATVSICFANDIEGLINIISINNLSTDEYIQEKFFG